MRKIALLLIAFALSVTLAGCEGAGKPSGPSYRYEIVGAGVTRATIVYGDITANGTGRERSQRNAKLPWRKNLTLTMNRFARVTARNVSGETGTLTCRIRRYDGADYVVLLEVTSATGFNPTVSCALA